jgi:hypothetical protein
MNGTTNNDQPPTTSHQRATINELAGIATLFVVAAIAFAQSYGRWLDPLIDTGRDLYIPEQLARGAKLYRDIRYQYPPLLPYLLSLITSAVGRSLASYMAIGIAQSVVAAAAIYLAARKAAGWLGAFAATLLFVSLCLTNASTWGVTWMFPYSYAATFGMTFLLIALAALLYERPALAVAALVLAAWCKVELAVAATLIVAGLTMTRRLAPRYAAAWLASMGVTFGIAALYFRDTAWLSGNLFAASLTQGESASVFFARVSGRADWLRNLGAALTGIGVIVIVKIAIRRFRWPMALAVVLACTLFVHDDQLIRAFGILQWVVLLAAAREENRPLFTLALFSIAATLRIWLNVSPGWYGFTLVAPVFVLMAAVLFERKRLAALWLIPIGVLCGRQLYEQHARYAVKTHPIVSMRGTFYDSNADRAAILDDFLRHVRGGTLVVIPEGLTLNYLAGATTPLTYHTLTPVEIDDPRIEAAIVRELAARPPDRIVILDRDVREFGYRGFGVDYGMHLAAWVGAHYDVEARLRGPRFWMVVFKRKVPPPGVMTPRGAPRRGFPSRRDRAPNRK